MKKLFGLLIILGLTITLSGCWAGEIAVETEFNGDGSGTRTFVLDVMDDTLSTSPIINPDDPQQTENKGAVVNNKHITGGIVAIQTWLEENSPEWMTVEEMTVDGYHRYFTLTYSFDSFEDFMDKYEELVNLSPNMSWEDFDDSEKPSWTCEGSIKKECTFTESKAIVEASLDWAIDGIYTDIYDAADLEGFVTKADIAKLANYTLVVGDTKVEDLQKYDATAVDGEGTGKVVYAQNSEWTATDEFTNTTIIIVIVVAVVAVLGAGAFAVLKLRKKQ